MSEEEFESPDSNGIKTGNISLKNKRTRLSPLLNRRKSSNQKNSALGNDIGAFENLDFPSSRLSPSLCRRSLKLSPRTCGCTHQNNTSLKEENCADCGGYSRDGKSNIDAAWNEPFLGQNNACKLYTTEDLLRHNSNTGARRERVGLDDMQVHDMEDTPSSVDYSIVESKARLPKIVVTDTQNKRPSQNVLSETEFATPIKLPPISPASPRASLASKLSDLYRIPEHDQVHEKIPE